MELLQQALSEHEDKLAKLRVNADNLHDALSRGENLRNVVALSRNLRQELAYTHEYFQACGPFPASICLVCRPLAKRPPCGVAKNISTSEFYPRSSIFLSDPLLETKRADISC